MPRFARKLIAAFAMLVLTLSTPALAAKIMVVSDLHYMARSLYQGSALFLQALRAGDGKYTQYSEALMAALGDQVRSEGPDALIVTGDLTFNGERDSHIALAKWLSQIEAQGTPVWVIPGNHDINVPTARGFAGDGWYYTDPVAPEEFSSIYADFMQSPEGDGGLSYTARVGDGLWVAMTDVAYYTDSAQTFGLFTAAHAEWLESVLSAAGDVTVITATHHNLLPHTQFAQDSFLMFGHETMAGLARQYGVRLNLSGHMHAQHVAREDALTDAALGAFCTWPHRYAIVTTEGTSIAYKAKSLDAAYLPEGFIDDSRAWFEGITREKIETALGDIDEAERAPMVDYATRFNMAYFSGTYRSNDPAWQTDPACTLWRSHGDNLLGQYMNTVMNEPTGNNLSFSLP